MPGESSNVDNRSDVLADKSAIQSGSVADVAPVEDFLQLLGRAVRQFHTYPATSPLCIDAVTACHKALSSIEYRDRLAMRVSPHALIVDETEVGANTIIEHEIVRRLSRARVAGLDIDRTTASTRDLTRFCLDLVGSEELDIKKTSFAELLAEHGVDTIVATQAHRPEVLEVGVPAAPTRELLAHERQRQYAALASDAPVSYLYPPDKGWVRFDPSESIDAVTLVDLVVLVDDPADVATMLLKLTGEETAADNRETALERKFTDVTTLFSALDPRLARVMFGRLARAVLQLDPERRKNLLQRTILPGLLDGRADGNVLRDFPDADLAESLCLLLELETAAPEVLNAALNHLDLSAERRQAVVPLMDERLRARRAGEPDALGRENSIDRYAKALVKVDTTPKDYSDFAAFDLSIDDHAVTAVGAVRSGIRATDEGTAQLQCVWQLVRLEPNPTIVEALLERTLELFAGLERASRWPDLAASATAYRKLANEIQGRRPDVADTIQRTLSRFATTARVGGILDLYQKDTDGRRVATDLIRAFGAAFAPAMVELLDDPAQQARTRALTTVMCEHAVLLAPALEAGLEACRTPAQRVIVRVLGYAGAGHEAAVNALAGHHDEQLQREAFRALARIGTDAAAAMVGRRIREAGAGKNAAEEALWHFSPAQSANQVRELLRSREFVLHNPQTVTRLLDRAKQNGAQDLDEGLAQLEPLWRHFWSPGLVRLALKARELRTR